MVKRERLREQAPIFSNKTKERKVVVLDKWIDRKCQLEKLAGRKHDALLRHWTQRAEPSRSKSS